MIPTLASIFLFLADAAENGGSNTGLYVGGTAGLGLIGWMVRELRALKDGIKSELKAEAAGDQQGAKTHISNAPLIVRGEIQYATVAQLATHAAEDEKFHGVVQRDIGDIRVLLQAREDRLHDRVNKLTEKVGELVGQLKLKGGKL